MDEKPGPCRRSFDLLGRRACRHGADIDRGAARKACKRAEVAQRKPCARALLHERDRRVGAVRRHVDIVHLGDELGLRV
jgi:hypothetical protein